MYELYTATAHFAVIYAHKAVRRLKHRAINTEHLLLGTCQTEEEISKTQVHPVLSYASLQPRVEALHPANSEPYNEHIPIATPAKEVLEHAHHLSILHRHQHIGTEHILLALTLSDTPIMTRLFDDVHISREQIFMDVMKLARERAATAHPSFRAATNVEARHDVLRLIADDTIGRHQLAEAMSKIVDLLDSQRLLMVSDILKRSR